MIPADYLPDVQAEIVHGDNPEVFGIPVISSLALVFVIMVQSITSCCMAIGLIVALASELESSMHATVIPLGYFSYKKGDTWSWDRMEEVPLDCLTLWNRCWMLLNRL